MAKIPPSNVGPMSQQWADWITAQTITNQNGVERLGGDASNDGRVNNSQMDIISSQINEIYQRQSGQMTIASFTTQAFGVSVPSVSHNRTFNVPAPTDARRIGWLSVQITARTSNNNTLTVVDVSALNNGSQFYHDARPIPEQTSYPSVSQLNWAFIGYTSLTAGPGGVIPVRLNLTATGADAGTVGRTITYSNITLTYQWGQKA